MAPTLMVMDAASTAASQCTEGLQSTTQARHRWPNTLLRTTHRANGGVASITVRLFTLFSPMRLFNYSR